MGNEEMAVLKAGFKNMGLNMIDLKREFNKKIDDLGDKLDVHIKESSMVESSHEEKLIRIDVWMKIIAFIATVIAPSIWTIIYLAVTK